MQQVTCTQVYPCCAHRVSSPRFQKPQRSQIRGHAGAGGGAAACLSPALTGRSATTRTASIYYVICFSFANRDERKRIDTGASTLLITGRSLTFLFSPMASLFNSSMQEREHSCMHDHVVTEHGKALHALYITKGNSKETKGENQQL